MSALILAAVIIAVIAVAVCFVFVAALVILGLVKSAVQGIINNPMGAQIGCAAIVVFLVLTGSLLLFDCVPEQ